MDKADFYREARNDLTGPLHGVRVMDVTTSWAGPMCGCVLADLGADVIKIEALRGEVGRRLPPFLPDTNPPLSFFNATVNRNKRNLTLELKSPEGREIFLKLAARTDVIVESFKPATMDGWGLGYRAVRAVKPDIVYVSISGWGQWGPDHARPGYDPAAQAASGFLSLNGIPDGPPVKAPTFLCDDLAGLHGAIGAIAALRHRDRTGEGQHVDVALLDAMLFQSNGFPTLGAMGAPMERWGNEFIFAIPANTYRCRDGLVHGGALLDSHWKTIARMAGRPDLADHPEYATLAGRIRHRRECDALLAGWCAERAVAEAVEQCARQGITCAAVRSYAEAARDPHVLARDMIQPTPLEDGTVAPLTGPAAKFSRTPTRIRSGAAALGAHNDEILEEIGFDAEARRRLREKKVI
jgi:crotonobetainyl-CoA:carnitine CoA-transferase CaiB-like acyl-CoA transferase